MGVLYSYLGGQFLIASHHKSDALKALQDFLVAKADPYDYTYFPERIKNTQSLVTAFDGMYFKAQEDEKGNITSIRYIADKICGNIDSMESMLRVLTPFVQEGSYLTFDEEGEIEYTLTFTQGKLKLQYKEK